MQMSLFRPDSIHENTVYIVPLLTDIYSSGLLGDQFTSRAELAGLSLICFAGKYPTLFTETHTLDLGRVIDDFQNTEPSGDAKYRVLHAFCTFWALGDFYSYFGLFWEIIGIGNSQVRMMELEAMYFIVNHFHIGDSQYKQVLKNSLRHNVAGASAMLYIANRMQRENKDRIRLAEELKTSEEYRLSSDAIEKFTSEVVEPFAMIYNPFASTVEEVQAFIIDTLFFGVW